MPVDPKILQIVNAPADKRHSYVINALKAGAMAPVLFIYAVDDYKHHPNKKKALFLFSEFLYAQCHDAQARWQDPSVSSSAIDLSINMEFSNRTKQNLRSSFEQMEMDRTKAKKMNIFKRLDTSDKRKADPDAFDSALHELTHVDPSQSPFGRIMLVGIEGITTASAESIYRKEKAALPGLMKRMQACGFDLDRIGLDSKYARVENLATELGF
jgi:hypothetical protein